MLKHTQFLLDYSGLGLLLSPRVRPGMIRGRLVPLARTSGSATRLLGILAGLRGCDVSTRCPRQLPITGEEMQRVVDVFANGYAVLRVDQIRRVAHQLQHLVLPMNCPIVVHHTLLLNGEASWQIGFRGYLPMPIRTLCGNLVKLTIVVRQKSVLEKRVG